MGALTTKLLRTHSTNGAPKWKWTRGSSIAAGCVAFLVSSLLVANPTNATVTLASTNVIQNGSFESVNGPDSFPSWALDLKSGASAALSVDTTTSVQGSNSARIDVRRTTGAFWGIQLDQTVPVISGQTYSISFWAKASSPRDLPFELQQATNPYSLYVSSAASLTTSWQQFTVQYTATVSDASALFHLSAGLQSGSVWFDAIAIVASATNASIPATATATNTLVPPTATATNTMVPPTATATNTMVPPTATATNTSALPITALGNEILNSSFELQGNPGPTLFAPWLLNAKSGAAASLNADTSTAVSGATSARVDVTQVNGNFWGIQFDQAVPLVSGSRYSVSFWAKASSSVSLPISFQQATSPFTVYFSPSAMLTTSWQQFTFQYNSTVTDPSALLHLDLGSQTGSIWIDDVAVMSQTGGTPLAPLAPLATSYFRGVDLKGGEQGLCCGTDTFAPPATLDWLKSENLTTFRVPFAWAHLQPFYFSPLNPVYLAMMDTLVANARERGERVAFVPMDRSTASAAALADLWTRVATHYKNETAIWGYDLMNEPTGDAWNTTTAPAVIAAIRQVDMTHTIILETSTGGWGQYWNSHTVGLPMQDPANNLLYEAHFYFDTPANGTYPQGTAFSVPNNDLNIGVERATDFVNWCKANSVPCYVGEYGVPGGWVSGNAACTNGAPQTDPRWLTVLDNFLSYLDQNHISATYWAAGPFGDVNDLGPTCSGLPRPQLAVLERHLGSN